MKKLSQLISLKSMTHMLMGILLFIFISSSAFGQIEKGSKLLGGNFHLSTDKSSDSDRMYRFNATPNLGIFLMDNFALGGAMTLRYFKSGEWSHVSLGIAPFFRYYFELSKSKEQDGLLRQQAGKTWLFLHAQPGFSWSQTRSTSDEKSSRDILGIGLGIGLTYFITDNIGIEGILSYNTEDFYLSFSGLVFNVGFQIYLPKGKKE